MLLSATDPPIDGELAANPALELQRLFEAGGLVAFWVGVTVGVVVTSDAEVSCAGTEFTVVAGAVTAVESDAGSVRVTRPGDGRSADVPAGHFLVAAADTVDFAAHPVAALQTLPHATLPFDRAQSIVWSADGTRLSAASSRRFATLSADPAVKVPLADVPLPGETSRAILSADATRVLCIRRDDQLTVVDSASGNVISEQPTTQPVATHHFAMSPAGDRIAGFEPKSYPPGRLAVRPVEPRSTASSSILLGTVVRAVAFSPDGNRIATATVRPGQFQDRRVQVWDVAGGRRVTATAPLEVPVVTVVFSPDGRLLAGADERGGVHVWNADTGDWIASRGTADGWVRRTRVIAFSPDGRLLAAGTEDGRVHLWDLKANRDAGSLKCGSRITLSLAFSPNGEILAACLNGGQIQLWNLPKFRSETMPL